MVNCSLFLFFSGGFIAPESVNQLRAGRPPKKEEAAKQNILSQSNDPKNANSNGQANGQTNGQANGQVNGQANGQQNGQQQGNQQNKESSQYKLLSKGEIKKLQNSGIDPHDLKPKKGGSQYDLYKDNKGNIFVRRKGGKGEADPTGLNINDY